MSAPASTLTPACGPHCGTDHLGTRHCNGCHLANPAEVTAYGPPVLSKLAPAACLEARRPR